jgi:hypothetical protein
MKKENVRVGRGTDAQGNKYVLLVVGGKQIPLDPEKAEEFSRALSAAAQDVKALRDNDLRAALN